MSPTRALTLTSLCRTQCDSSAVMRRSAQPLLDELLVIFFSFPFRPRAALTAPHLNQYHPCAEESAPGQITMNITHPSVAGCRNRIPISIAVFLNFRRNLNFSMENDSNTAENFHRICHKVAAFSKKEPSHIRYCQI